MTHPDIERCNKHNLEFRAVDGCPECEKQYLNARTLARLAVGYAQVEQDDPSPLQATSEA